MSANPLVRKDEPRCSLCGELVEGEDDVASGVDGHLSHAACVSAEWANAPTSHRPLDNA